MSIQITKLENGLTVATDEISSIETVSAGIFVNVGSVNESDKQIGISHFLEHMAFKGTETRSALQISDSIESVGGIINAYTSKEITAFYTKVLKKDAELAVDIITDIIQNSVFDNEEFEKERGVIIQEIRQLNDSPDELVFDMFQSKCFEGEKLGTQILGSEDNINSMQPKDLQNYLNTKYSSDKIMLSVSGNIPHDKVVDLASKFTPKLANFKTEEVPHQQYKGGLISKRKDLEQTHLILGFEGLEHKNENKFSLSVFSTILGGGMSSRLFQEIREKRGLVYSIFSFNSNYRDTGTFGIYAGCNDKDAEEVIDVIRNEIVKLRSNITIGELTKAKTQIKASILMGLESSSARMERLANQHILHEKIQTPEEIASKIDQINIDSIDAIIDKILLSKPTLAITGILENAKNLDQFT